MKNNSIKSIYHILCDKIKKQSFQVILYGMSPEEKREFLKAWLKALGETGCGLAVIPVSGDRKTAEFDKRVLKASAVLLSCKPEGMFVLQNPEDLRFITKSFITEIWKNSKITGIKNFKYIGYIGWESINRAGKEIVDVDYYTSKISINGKTYRFFLAITHHSAIGCNSHSPKWFTTTTDWNTKIWPGQVLHDWEPKNEGLNTQITYTLTSIAPVIVSYSVPEGLTVEWVDQTSPDTGYVKTLHKILNARSGVIYAVESSSIGLLDPTRPGGYLPMIVDHDFKVELQKPVFLWADTKTIDINFTAALYDCCTLHHVVCSSLI